MVLSADPGLLGVDLNSSLTASPSTSTFLPEEDASTCPLLSATPSPPPMDFINIHPLTPSPANEGNDHNERDCDNERAETSSSSGSSSGIGIQISSTGATNLFNHHVYQHIGKNGDLNLQADCGLKNGLSESKVAPRFVNWNWPIIRKCTFVFSVSMLLAMIGVIVGMLVSIPKSCNPPITWYNGGVFYEIFPASFQDSNNDGIGDLKGIASRANYLENLGVSAVRLNSIYPTKHSYPEHFQNIVTLMKIDEVLGEDKHLLFLAETLHERNISLILDLPVYPFIQELHPTINSRNESQESNETMRFVVDQNEEENIILKAIQHWLTLGVDGFYIKGLENLTDDPFFMDNIKEWKQVLGKDRIIIVNENVVKNLDEAERKELKRHIDLIDVFLDVSNGTGAIAEQIKVMLKDEICTGKDGNNPWTHWTLAGVSDQRLASGLSSNATLAAMLMHLMLPGTPSIFYGDEISLQEVYDPLGDHAENKHLHHLSTMIWNTGTKFTNRESIPWIPLGASASFHHFDYIAGMIELRKISPSLYENSIIRDSQFTVNTAVRYSQKDILIMERWYRRRNTFISVTNFSNKKISLDLSSIFYSGVIMLGKATGNKIFFDDFVIGPMETLIVRLDK